MRFSPTLLFIPIILFFNGCSIHHPQTAEEFRLGVPTAFLGGVETFEVDRSYKDIGKTFQKKAPQCLGVTIESVSQSSTSYSRIVTTYNPSVQITDKRAELHLQQEYKSGVMTVSKVPPGGYYIFVVDATPIGKNKSKVDIYGPTMGYDTLIRAFKGWATGKNMGCPDLTQN